MRRTAEEATGDETTIAGNGDVTGADHRVARGNAHVTGIGNDAETAKGIETGPPAERERGGETESVIETGGESESSS